MWQIVTHPAYCVLKLNIVQPVKLWEVKLIKKSHDTLGYIQLSLSILAVQYLCRNFDMYCNIKNLVIITLYIYYLLYTLKLNLYLLLKYDKTFGAELV